MSREDIKAKRKEQLQESLASKRESRENSLLSDAKETVEAAKNVNGVFGKCREYTGKLKEYFNKYAYQPLKILFNAAHFLSTPIRVPANYLLWKPYKWSIKNLATPKDKITGERNFAPKGAAIAAAITLGLGAGLYYKGIPTLQYGLNFTTTYSQQAYMKHHWENEGVIFTNSSIAFDTDNDGKADYYEVKARIPPAGAVIPIDHDNDGNVDFYDIKGHANDWEEVKMTIETDWLYKIYKKEIEDIDTAIPAVPTFMTATWTGERIYWPKRFGWIDIDPELKQVNNIVTAEENIAKAEIGQQALADYAAESAIKGSAQTPTDSFNATTSPIIIDDSASNSPVTPVNASPPANTQKIPAHLPGA